jgi:hypothetical protein
MRKIYKHVRIYDNGGKTADRYTAVYIAQPLGRGLYDSVGMCENPFHPQGIGQHSSAMPGGHLGKRIDFEALPADCQALVKRDLQNAAMTVS